MSAPLDPLASASEPPLSAGSASAVLRVLGEHVQFHVAGIGVRGRTTAGSPSCLPAGLLQGWLATGRSVSFVVQIGGRGLTISVGSRGDSGLEHFACAVAASLGSEMLLACPAGAITEAHAELGCVVGIPKAVETEASHTSASPLDLLLDTLGDRNFWLAVVAMPAPADDVRAYLNTFREQAEALDRDYLAMPQQADVHRVARRRRDWLDRMIARLQRGLGLRMWRAWTIAAADDAATLRQGLGILTGALGDLSGESLLPVTPVFCSRSASEGPLDPTLLDSRELAPLLMLPTRERVGFSVHRAAAFDLNHPAFGEGAIEIGTILDGERSTGRSFSIPSVELTRHAFVAGHTGSGKTTLVRRMLCELDRMRVPFLVLEPAKGEYRMLADSVRDLGVFSVGNLPQRGELPFQMNPFAFPSGFPLHTHVDLLKNAFTASFGLVPPGPYLLETAIYRAYEARGWSTETGEHPNGCDPLAFPTLTDLLDQVGPVVHAAGYDVEVSRNLRGALRTRIGNLRIGPKGLALDTRNFLPDELLFDRPMVLELRHLGSDAEKAFVMSLLLMRLYEVRERQGLPPGREELRHLLVVEEAHRLLRRQTERAGEEGNMAHEAVRAFENLISEVRAYGQGVALIDQLPSAMSPGAFKQTGLRIVHRLIPRDDREAVGDVLSSGQKEALAFLRTGQAVVHAEGMDGAIRIAVPAPRSRETRSSAHLRDGLREGIGAALRARLEKSILHARNRRTLYDREVCRAADAAVLTAVIGADELEAMTKLQETVGRVMRSSRADEARDRLAMAALEEALTRRAIHYRWTQRQLDGVLDEHRQGRPLSALLVPILDGAPRRHSWCGACPAPCRLGYEGALLSHADDVHDRVSSISGHSHEEWADASATTVSMEVRQLLPGVETLSGHLALCAAGHVLATHGISSRQIEAVTAIFLDRAH